MTNEAMAGNTDVEGVLPKDEEERLNYVADLLKAKGISKDCAIWMCVSSADAGKLEEFIHFIENNPISDRVLYAWDEKNVPRKRDLYEYEEGVEYEFVGFEED